jgi:HlyD family secretion protein
MAGFFCNLPIIATLFANCAPPLPLATGYVEGEYALIAPVATARINNLAVQRGDKIIAGQVLATLEKRDAEISVTENEATLARAVSQLKNLTQGRRPEEIAVIDAALVSARAKEVEAEKEAARVQNLYKRGAVAATQIDVTETALNVARAGVAEGKAKLAVARLPARPAQIAAAQASVTQAEARRDAAKWRLQKRTIVASGSGTVDEILRRVGEIASPQAPIMSILPQGGIKLRLYVPEASIYSIRLGTILSVRCDGCAPDATARVTYVSNGPEFTPPVIYSLQNRQKLVYLIEATPDKSARFLKPGQIVDVDIPSE